MQHSQMPKLSSKSSVEAKPSASLSPSSLTFNGIGLSRESQRERQLLADVGERKMLIFMAQGSGAGLPHGACHLHIERDMEATQYTGADDNCGLSFHEPRDPILFEGFPTGGDNKHVYISVSAKMTAWHLPPPPSTDVIARSRSLTRTFTFDAQHSPISVPRPVPTP